MRGLDCVEQPVCLLHFGDYRDSRVRNRETNGLLETIIEALHRRGPESLHSLTAVSNNAGASIPGGLGALTQSGQVERLILSFIGSNKVLEKKYLEGKIAIELCPQGTIAERLRAGGAGIPAFYTPTGVSEWTF